MMLYWRHAIAAENKQFGQLAITTHAAVAAAIINTIAGKEAPEFREMVARLIQHEGEETATPTMPAGIPGIASSESGGLEGFEPF